MPRNPFSEISALINRFSFAKAPIFVICCVFLTFCHKVFTFPYRFDPILPADRFPLLLSLPALL